VLIDRLTPLNKIEIWEPRWKDRKVLIATYKVGEHNKIVFTKAPSMPGEYYLSGKTIKKCPKETNGKIPVYAVPVDKLEKLEINERDWRMLG